jgi:hypothetical protein
MRRCGFETGPNRAATHTQISGALSATNRYGLTRKAATVRLTSNTRDATRTADLAIPVSSLPLV